MLAVVSPAKRLDEGPAIAGLPYTMPELLDDAAVLAAQAARLDADDLRDLMGISPKLAALNVARFEAWHAGFGPDEARQAVRMVAGDTYVGLDAATLTAADLTWAQDHLAILSGLYGVLRPLDLMLPYRLEMGTRLDTARGRGLVAFWGDRVARALAARLAGHAERTVVNLASVEYFSAVDLAALDARVVTPVFQEVDADGRPRVLQFYAKKARGSMARFLVQHRLERAAQLQAFDVDGYRFDAAASEGDTWVFRRPKP